MDDDAVEDYVEQSQQLIEASPQMNEESTKAKLVQPLLELLGWNVRSTEVSFEYPVQFASRTTHVDFALLVGDSPVVFVEAKPVRSSLSKSNLEQLQSYMRQELEVDWGILTNGESFEVLTKNQQQNGGEEVSVVEFDLNDLSDKPGVLELLTKESIRSGKSDEIAAQVAETNRAIRHLQENEDEVTTAVSDAVKDEVGDLTINLEEQSREFVQGLVSRLREQRQFVSTDTEQTRQEINQASSEQGGLESTDDGAESVAKSIDSGYAVQFSNGRFVPQGGFSTHEQQKTNMGEAVDYLVEEHNLTSKVPLPYTPSSARKNCSLNDEPEHPHGEEMRGAYELSDGSYLYTHLNTRMKKSRLRDLAEKVGLSVEFLGEWTDDAD